VGEWDAACLVGDKLGWGCVYGLDALGVLGDERGDDARSVASVRGKRLEVGLRLGQVKLYFSLWVRTWIPAPPLGSVPAMVSIESGSLMVAGGSNEN
jgi:hypothetical protein